MENTVNIFISLVNLTHHPMDPDEILNSGNSADDEGQQLSTQEILRDLNETQGAGMGVSAKTDTSTPPATPDATQAPATPEKPGDHAKTEAPKTHAPSTTSTSKTVTRDPDWANRDKDKQPDASTPKVETDANPNKAESPEAFSRLSELTDGAIKSEKDFTSFVSHYNELVKQAEEGFQPKFRNETHKLAFDILANVPAGQELDKARTTLHTLSLDVSKLAGKDLLFESFLLDPDNSDLTREKAWEYFEAAFEKRFGDASENKLTERELQKEERKAKESILNSQKSFLDATAKSTEEPKVDETVLKSVERAVDQFGGLEIAFSENAQDNEFLRIKVDSNEELQQLREYSLNPQLWWKDLVNEFTGEKGFDYNGFVRELYELKNHHKIKRMAFNHGLEQGKLGLLNKTRNSTTAAEKTLENSRVPSAGKKEAGSFVEAWEGALNK
jgi:hypothetical protein